MKDVMMYFGTLHVDGRDDVEIDFPSIKAVKNYLATEWPGVDFVIMRTTAKKRRRSIYFAHDDSGRRIALDVVSRWKP